MKNIVGQAETSIDFRRAIENKEIILIKLPRKILPQDAALIGTMLTAQIHAAIFSFADMPAERRPGFSLYVDEFEHFATNDFAEMFAEGRKYGVRLTLAHQTRSQIPRTLEVLRSTTFNAATVLCFSAPDDASEMARLFPAKATVRPEDIDPDPVDFLLKYGHDAPVMDFFTREYVRPLANRLPGLKGLRVQEGKHTRTSNVMYEEVKQDIAELSRFLYEVEKSGNWQQPIPYKHAENWRGHIWDVWEYVLLTYPGGTADRTIIQKLLALPLSDAAQVEKVRQFILSLPVREHDMREYYKWKDASSSLNLAWASGKQSKQDYADAVASLPIQRENFLTLLTTLRKVMAYLATNPIGKQTAPSTAQVATQIISLKSRQALVKTTQATHQIQTIDTRQIKTAPLQEQQTRKRAILEQTRKKYCKPADEVTEELLQRAGIYYRPEKQPEQEQTSQDGKQEQGAEEAPASSWEEM